MLLLFRIWTRARPRGRTSSGSAVFWASDAVEVGAVGLVGSVVGGSDVGSVVGGSEVGSASR